MKTKNTTTLRLGNLISRSPLRRGLLFIPLALVCFALSPTAQAVSPPPDGGYFGNNTAEGDNALLHLTTGADNTAAGFNALEENTTGSFNTANGFNALFSNTTGNYHTATGLNALINNTTGNNNTANGVFALNSNTTGSGNTALGASAGKNLTTGSNNIDIGNVGLAGESTTIRIGSVQTETFIAGIRGVAVTGAAVVVSSSGQLGVAPSSERFKAEIKPMDKASEALLSLRPVTFRYTHELDPAGIPQFGLVAEQVEKVNSDLVARDAQGKVYTVRYEAVNAMLLNEFLKEHRKMEEQEATITHLKKEFHSKLSEQQKDFQAAAAHQQEEIRALTASLKEQASQIQKVSALLELRKPAPQTLANNQ